jgi:hypothetical protein
MGGVGGYVRRGERKPFYEPRYSYHPWGYSHFVLPSGMVITIPKEPPLFQSMPILKFEQFDVAA